VLGEVEDEGVKEENAATKGAKEEISTNGMKSGICKRFDVKTMIIMNHARSCQPCVQGEKRERQSKLLGKIFARLAKLVFTPKPGLQPTLVGPYDHRP